MPSWTENGGFLAAMCGKDCVTIATDYNPGGHQTEMLDSGFKKVFKVTPRSFLGLTGSQMDILAVRDRAMKRQNQSEVIEDHEMSPKQLSIALSKLLFKQREKPYYVESVVAGLEPDPETGTLKPYICYLDWTGCRREHPKYVAAGTCNRKLEGMCANQWQPDLSPDDLFAAMSTALYRTLVRDPTTRLGTSALIYIIGKESITERLVEIA
ncbi:hypothetical protein KR054_011141 [Drosophila jambulina]|nr:hypothetical protein KR054_011141 [Drosophila jambulina]